jgi:two-component system, NarL family, invasion response regulator UvrY
MATIAIVDDFMLIRGAFSSLVCRFGHSVITEADNGKILIENIEKHKIPDIILLDIVMPEMDGYSTARWLSKHHPQIKVLALSAYNNEIAVIGMLKCGAKGFISKNVEPEMLNAAINCIYRNEPFFLEAQSNILAIIPDHHTINKLEQRWKHVHLTPRQTEFLGLACSEMAYKEIAEKMGVSPRTIDEFRDQLFEKLGIRTRIGLAIYAVRCGLALL